MYGYPKTIRTRADVNFLMGYLGSKWATAENVQRGLSFLRGLKDDKSYVFDRVLAEAEEPEGPEPDYLVLVQEDGARHQMRLDPDPSALIHRLGLTQADVDQMIATVEAAR